MNSLVVRLATVPGRLLKLVFSAAWRGFVVLTVIGFVAAATAGKVEKTGDNLQVALPLLAWGCAAANGAGVEYLGRYAVMFFAAHGTKAVLGDSDINHRPYGGSKGMPSAHTSTAVLGASRLVSGCLTGNPLIKGVVIISAGFVGASRIDAGAHTIWQVLAGAIFGMICDLAFGKGSVSRRWLIGRLRRRA